MSKKNTFHLGITMAGAVSAGAYSAGFMDYLLEVLKTWQTQKDLIKKKTNNNQPLNDYEKKIPLHDVKIDVLGGASAGGMVSMITALTAFLDITPVKEPTNQKTGNILYDSWVLLDDDIDENSNITKDTFKKMLSIDDIINSDHGVSSLLNSNSIDKIAEKIFSNFNNSIQTIERPKYFSQDLRVLLTLCSLRGVPFEFNFENITSAHFPHVPGHRMNEHMLIAHFKLHYNKTLDKDIYLKFDPNDSECKELLKLSTKATGAFPLGLAPRHFKNKFSKDYIKNSILRNLEIDEKDKESIDLKVNENFFDFTSIDGGTINNEPYSEVVKVLENNHPLYNPEYPNFGTIMIDPFPNFYNQDEAKTVENPFDKHLFQKNIWTILPKIYSTFRQQVRVKHSGSFYKDYFRLLVFPIKWENKGVLRNHPPLACSSLGGFGGFLDIEFRKHDFFLGRNNARNFLRAYFMLEYDKDKLHPLFENLTQESLNAFRRKIKSDGAEEEKIYFPIIPDLNYLYDKENDNTNPYNYDYDNFPTISLDYFTTIKPDMKKRLHKMLTNEINNRFKEKWILRNALKLVTGMVSKRVTRVIVKMMRKDFENRNMISK